MTPVEELELFLVKANDLVDSKYVLADIKIVNLLKAIASSDCIIALFKNCLKGFDYENAKKRYLVKSQYLAQDKGEFITPSNPKDLLAFVLNILTDIDAKIIILSEFLDRFFYEDGSCYASYSSFINKMIIPFRNAVKSIMEKVIDGSIQNPVDAMILDEEKEKTEKEESLKKEQADKELLKEVYGKSLKAIKDILFADKKKIKDSKLKEEDKEELTLIVDMFANALESKDKDAISYAFISYKYVTKAHFFLFFNRIRKISRLLGDVINGI